tara:strand:- start:43 stop:630 length:588 start_codon:yes stop_codon:yes gene_type:complete
MKVGEFKVVDDYFPKWLIHNVSNYIAMIPVRWDNSPYRDTFSKCRFMGNMLMEKDEWQLKDVPNSWFLQYLIESIKLDICKEYNITNTLRCLHNGQFPMEIMNAVNHTDADNDKYLSVIYMGHGASGDTVLCDNDGNDVERVSFKEGRMVIFNSHQLHRGEAPTEGYRCTWGLVFPLFDPTFTGESINSLLTLRP